MHLWIDTTVAGGDRVLLKATFTGEWNSHLWSPHFSFKSGMCVVAHQATFFEKRIFRENSLNY